jgi:hypothetical protein
MTDFRTHAEDSGAVKFWDFSLGGIVQSAGIFFGILIGTYLPGSVLPADAGLWTKLAVGLVIGMTIFAFFRVVGAGINRRRRSQT